MNKGGRYIQREGKRILATEASSKPAKKPTPKKIQEQDDGYKTNDVQEEVPTRKNGVGVRD